MASNLDIGRVHRRFTEKASVATAAVLSYKMLSPEVARVVMSVSKTDMTTSEAHEAIASAFDNQASAIPGSFRVIPNASVPAVLGFVTVNKRVREYSSTDGEKFRVMAGNILMDKEDESLWELREGEHGRYLVRHQEESLAELVEVAKVVDVNAARRIPEVASIAELDEFVAYVDTQTASVKYGQVVDANNNELSVILPGSKIVEISSDQLVEIAALTDSPIIDTSEKTKMLDYYKELYKYAPEYYEEVKKQIEMHSFA